MTSGKSRGARRSFLFRVPFLFLPRMWAPGIAIWPRLSGTSPTATRSSAARKRLIICGWPSSLTEKSDWRSPETTKNRRAMNFSKGVRQPAGYVASVERS